MSLNMIFANTKEVFNKTCPDSVTMATGAAKKDLLSLGSDAYVLLHEYVLEAKDKQNMSNQRMAARLGWKASKVSEVKEVLIAAGWYSEDMAEPVGRNKNTVNPFSVIYIAPSHKNKPPLTTYFIYSPRVANPNYEDM